MNIDLLPNSDCKRIIEKIGEDIVDLHKKRIDKKIQVDGSRMPPLSSVTIKKKRKKGAKEPTKRMVDTGDFVEKAFEFKAFPDTLSVGISNKIHKKGKVSYKFIAWSQESSRYGREGLRKEGNPGANFFGLTPQDMQGYREQFAEMAIPIMKKNFYDYLTKALRIK